VLSKVKAIWASQIAKHN